ncbi:MAG: glycosyltransferase family 4 protein [Fimbriimonadaceae bacterium]
MKVVYANRSDWRFRPGGDSVQMERTAEAIIRAFDCEIHFAESPTDPAIAACDLVHIFNTQTLENSLEYAQAAKTAGKPYLVSTIHWDLSHAMFVEFMQSRGWTPRASLKPGFDVAMGLAARLSGRPRYYSPSRKRDMRNLLLDAACLLPNSDEELSLMEQYVGCKLGRSVSVVNAIDPGQFHSLPGETREGCLVAARFLPVKNQLGVARAMQLIPEANLTMVGGCVDRGYLEAVQRESPADRTTVIAEDQDQAKLVGLYQSHKVHVLASFRESPGLSSLEGLACGCRVVVAQEAYCPVSFYFKDLVGTSVFPCDPYDPKDIARAIRQALESTAPGEPVEAALKKFTWAEAAKQTYSAYVDCLPK